jgi:hypothetical protein
MAIVIRAIFCVLLAASPLCAEDRVLYQEDFGCGKPGQSFLEHSAWHTGEKKSDIFLAAEDDGNLFVDGSTSVSAKQGASTVPFYSAPLTKRPEEQAGQYVVLQVDLRGGPGPKSEQASAFNSSIWLTDRSHGYEGVVARWHYNSVISQPPVPAWTFMTGDEAATVGQRKENYVQTDAIGGWVKSFIVVDLQQRTLQGMMICGEQRIVSKRYRISPGFDLWSMGHVVMRQDTRHGKAGLDMDNITVRQTDNNPIPVEQRGKVVDITGKELTGGPMSVGKWGDPSDEVVSPHIKWAKPAAGKPLRVLFITTVEALREVVEISQRFEIQRDVFALATAKKWV